jgi:hypothetical protein
MLRGVSSRKNSILVISARLSGFGGNDFDGVASSFYIEDSAKWI